MACWLLTMPDSKDGGEGRIKWNVSGKCIWLPVRTFSDLCSSQAESESLKVGPRNSRNLFLFLFVKLPGYCAARVESLARYVYGIWKNGMNDPICRAAEKTLTERIDLWSGRGLDDLKEWYWNIQGFHDGSDSQESTCNARDLGLIPGSGRSPGQEDLLEKGTATHSSVLAWRIPWSEEHIHSVQFSSVDRLCSTLCDPMAACQASLSITNSRNSLKLTSIELVMPSSHLILCRPLLLLPPIPPSIRVFSSEWPFRMRWPKYWSFSFSNITICTIDNQWRFACMIQGMPILCDSLEGWDGEGSGRKVYEGGDICISAAGSCWCMAETNSIL